MITGVYRENVRAGFVPFEVVKSSKKIKPGDFEGGCGSWEVRSGGGP